MEWLLAGEIYTITKVTVTNRADACPECATNLRVGVTNMSPQEDRDLELNSYTLCATEKPCKSYSPVNHRPKIYSTFTYDLPATQLVEYKD